MQNRVQQAGKLRSSKGFGQRLSSILGRGKRPGGNSKDSSTSSSGGGAAAPKHAAAVRSSKGGAPTAGAAEAGVGVEAAAAALAGLPPTFSPLRGGHEHLTAYRLRHSGGGGADAATLKPETTAATADAAVKSEGAAAAAEVAAVSAGKTVTTTEAAAGRASTQQKQQQSDAVAVTTEAVEAAVYQEFARHGAARRAASAQLLMALAEASAVDAQRDTALLSALRDGLRGGSPRGAKAAAGGAGAAAPASSRYLPDIDQGEEADEPLVSRRLSGTWSPEFTSPFESFPSSLASSARGMASSSEQPTPRLGEPPATSLMTAANVAAVAAAAPRVAVTAAKAAGTRRETAFSRYPNLPDELLESSEILGAQPLGDAAGASGSTTRRFKHGYPALDSPAMMMPLQPRPEAPAGGAQHVKARAAAAVKAADERAGTSKQRRKGKATTKVEEIKLEAALSAATSAASTIASQATDEALGPRSYPLDRTGSLEANSDHGDSRSASRAATGHYPAVPAPGPHPTQSHEAAKQVLATDPRLYIYAAPSAARRAHFLVPAPATYATWDATCGGGGEAAAAHGMRWVACEHGYAAGGGYGGGIAQFPEARGGVDADVPSAPPAVMMVA